MRVGIVGWRGMVGSVLIERMRAERDFAAIEPVFLSTTQAGRAAPDVGRGEGRVADANDLATLGAQDVIISCQGGDYTLAVHPQLRDPAHGDYRLSNCMMDPAGPVAGVLDWELCTLGEPMADLGGLLGYWHDPEATAAAFTANGWFRTGDAGRMTAQGTIYVVDRIKDMFISGGENVYPAEIEDVIASLDEVGLCAVIGVPDARWGEVGLALVVPRPGRAFDEERILAVCRERLARYKVPRRVQAVASLPLSPQGKVLKKELRRRYLEAGGTPPSQAA